MIKLFLCDDNCLHLKYTASYLTTLPLCAAFDIQTFSAPQELLAELQSGNTPDIAVLDVEMPKIDGLSLAKRLNRRHFLRASPSGSALADVSFRGDYIISRYFMQVYS